MKTFREKHMWQEFLHICFIDPHLYNAPAGACRSSVSKAAGDQGVQENAWKGKKKVYVMPEGKRLAPGVEPYF